MWKEILHVRVKGKYFLTLSHSCNINYDFEKYSSIILATICQRFRHFNPSVCMPKYSFIHWDPICNYYFSLTDSCNINYKHKKNYSIILCIICHSLRKLNPYAWVSIHKFLRPQRYWHYTYPPTKLICSSLQVKRWGVLTLHIPPTKLMCSSLQVKRGGYWHYTYPPTKLMCSSPSQEVGGIDITHTPYQQGVVKFPSQELSVCGEGGGGINYNAFK